MDFYIVDVFAEAKYQGNQLAVFFPERDLSGREMLRIAGEMNFSETTFVLSSKQADGGYDVRIFTPYGEVPFAGHPTLGSCHAWLEAGGSPRVPGSIVQECAGGLVRIEQSDGLLAFAAPPMQRSAPNPALLALVTGALGLRPQQVLAAQVLDNGPRWLALLLPSAELVLGLQPDHARLKDLGQDVGVVHVAPTASDTSRPGVTVRAFAAPMGNPEDPVTGSLNGSLAQWLIAEGLAPQRYLVAQGERLGRAGRVHIRQDEQGQVWVGGQSVTCIQGTALL